MSDEAILREYEWIKKWLCKPTQEQVICFLVRKILWSQQC